MAHVLRVLLDRVIKAAGFGTQVQASPTRRWHRWRRRRCRTAPLAATAQPPSPGLAPLSAAPATRASSRSARPFMVSGEGLWLRVLEEGWERVPANKAVVGLVKGLGSAGQEASWRRPAAWTATLP